MAENLNTPLDATGVQEETDDSDMTLRLDVMGNPLDAPVPIDETQAEGLEVPEDLLSGSGRPAPSAEAAPGPPGGPETGPSHSAPTGQASPSSLHPPSSPTSPTSPANLADPSAPQQSSKHSSPTGLALPSGIRQTPTPSSPLGAQSASALRSHTPVPGAAGDPGSAPPNAPFEMNVLIDDRYRLDGILGTGGMGVVYRAFDTRLERIVALKTIRFQAEVGETKAENLVKRFIRECKVLAALNHPNVVTVYDAGASQGILYLVMEYVEGKTLADALKESGAFSLDEAVDCIAQVCDGLASAHEHGVIHRDIKPANIMLLKNGLVKVMDFGLARGDQPSNGVTQLTAGLVVGTPEYMSPEQIKSEGVDHRSDLFSVGIVFYTLLTGERPFRGKQVMEIISSILFGTTQPPSLKKEDLDPKVDAVALRFLAKDPADRYTNAREAAEALRNLLQPLPTEMPELLDGMSFRRTLVEALPLPLARLYSRTFNTKDPRDRLSNTLFMTEAYIKLLSSICVTFYLHKLPNDPQIDESLRSVALPTLRDWLRWIQQIGEYSAGLPDKKASYPVRLQKSLREKRTEHEQLRKGCALLSELLGQSLEDISVLSFVSLAAELREKGAAKDELPLEKVDAVGVALFNALGDTFYLVDPLLRGQVLFIGESTRLSDGTVETPRISLQSALPLRISPLRTSTVKFQADTLYYMPLGDDDSWPLTQFITYLEHDLGADFYFLHYDLRSGDVHYLSYNTGHRYLSFALAEGQLALVSRLYSRQLTAPELKTLREQIRATHIDRLPKLGTAGPRGQISGDFEILEKVGEGGMGVVYKARQMSLNRIVALKVLARGRADNELMVARFKREVATLASCDHPKVVKNLDSGFEKGEYYYAMEYIDGITLSDLYSRLKHDAQNRPLADKDWTRLREEIVVKHQGPRRGTDFTDKTYFEAVSLIGRDVAFTLHHIHEMGIIHRDVKPSNIMLTRHGRVVLMDFGLAKGSTDLTMTVADHALGTVRYASPEQLQSRKLALDHRTDVYSLGASLYELASLQPVFEAETEVELITKLIYEEPLPLRKVNPEIPADLEVIINKCMSKRPEGRYPDASELGDDLENFLNGRHIKARPPSLTTVLLGTVRRHKEASVTAVAALLLIVAATVWGFFSIDTERDLAQQALAQANRNLTLAYANEGSFLLDRNRPLDAAFSYYRALRLEDTTAIRAGFMRAIDQSPALSVSLVGHRSPITALAVSPTLVVSADDGGRIKLWNLSKQRESASIDAHTLGVLALAFEPDADTLISSGGDRTIKLWSVSRQQAIASYDEQEKIHSIAVSSDGITLATGSEGGILRLHDLKGGKLEVIQTLRGHSGIIHSLAFSPDGKLLASGSADNTIKLWDVETKTELATFEHSSKVYSVAFSPNGQRVASAGADGSVKLWNVDDQHETLVVRQEASEDAVVAFSPDGKLVAYLGPDNTIKLWGVNEQREVTSISGHTYPVHALAFTPDGKTLVAGGEDEALKVWNLSPQRHLVTLTGHTGLVHSVAISPDGQTIASGGADTMLRLWNAQGSRDSFAGFELSDDVFSVAFSPDGKTVASGSGDGSVQIWDLAARKSISSFEGHEDLIWSVRFSPDGKMLASGGEDGLVKLWDVRGSSEIATLRGHTLGVNSLVFSPDGSKLISGSDDQTLKIWDVMAHRELDTLTGHTGFVYSVAISPDGKTLASGSADLVAKLWDISGPQSHEIATLTGHKDLVWTAAFSPDGKTLATGSFDNSIKLWDVQTRREIASLSGQGYHVSSVAFGPDGKLLISGSHNRAVLLWDLTFFTRPLSQIIAETKQDFLLPYRDSLFQPRFFASIATAVEDLLRANGSSVPLEAVEEVLWKFRDTSLSPGDIISLVYLLGPDNQVSISAKPGPIDLYSQQEWKSKPSRNFLLATGDYFLSRKNMKLADRCFTSVFQSGAPGPEETALKASIATIYIERDVASELPLRLALEATREDPANPRYQLVYSLALLYSDDASSAKPILVGLESKFAGKGEDDSAYQFAQGICEMKTGNPEAGKKRLEALADSPQDRWARKAAEYLQGRGLAAAPRAPEPSAPPESR